MTRGGIGLTWIGKLEDDIAITEGYEWKNGQPIFDATSKMLREIPKGKETGLHIGLAKWQAYSTWNPPPGTIWHET